MRDLLDPQWLEVLVSTAARRCLLAFDFDGTLAPIVEDRERARMRKETARLFVAVCERYPCSVISGRARADVASRLEGARVKYVVGDHGADLDGEERDEVSLEVSAAANQLRSELSAHPGVEIELKVRSLSVHVRRAADPARVLEQIARLVPRLPSRMRLVPGKLVANLLPEAAPNKGDALLSLWAAEGADAIVYLGDDTTDEDVFALEEREGLVTVRVGHSHQTSARYFIRSQRQIDRVLSALLRARSSGRRA